MRRTLPYAVTVCFVVGLLLALPAPLDAGTPQTEKKAGNSKAARPAAKTPSPPRCLCQAHTPKRPHVSLGAARPHTIQGKGSGQSPSWNKRAREAALLRRIMLARLPLMTQEPRPRLLDEWQIRLIDGDTFAYGAQRIRVRGIDTPEVSESGGFEATQRLDLLLHEGPVTIVPEALDKYGRTVADVYVNDRNVADVLKAEGYAKAGSR